MTGLRQALLLVWDRVHGTFWFVPALMTVLAGVVAVAALSIDGSWDADGSPPVLLFTGGPEAGRAVLQAIAGSTITVAGVVFSVTVAALSTTSQQLGPLVLRRFMRDLGNQVALGTFIATFAYCLIVLRAVRSGDDQTVVPHLSITIALGLAMSSVAILIFFLHHVTSAMRASHVIDAAGRELEEAIRRRYPLLSPPPDAIQSDQEARAIEAQVGRNGMRVLSRKHGYVQQINVQALRRYADAQGLLLILRCAPGDYLHIGSPLLDVSPVTGARLEAEKRAGRAVATDAERTTLQDPAFGAQQLCQIVLRALSPSVNDPLTASNGIARLLAACAHLGGRHAPPTVHRGADARVLVVERVQSIADVLRAAFQPIVDVVTGQPALVRQLLAGIGDIRQTLNDDDDEARAALDEIAQAIFEGARRHEQERALPQLEAALREATEDRP